MQLVAEPINKIFKYSADAFVIGMSDNNMIVNDELAIQSEIRL